jgi:uncharacterized Zn finger protein
MSETYLQSNREWWAQRWIDVLESFGWAARMARARTYAREGNVLRLEFVGPKVQAQVQGTAPSPYEVTLSLDPFSDEQWGYVIETMAERAIFSAKLLAGEMPQTIEEVFTSNGLSLFPFTKFDIHSRCNCPDKANPCKHIGAVYYLLGDRFSQDPFVLFQLRGRTKQQLLEALRTYRQTDSAIAAAPLPSPLVAPLPLEQFWSYTAPLDPSLIVITPPVGDETVLDVLGPIPEDTDGLTLKGFKEIYARLAQDAVAIAMQVD